MGYCWNPWKHPAPQHALVPDRSRQFRLERLPPSWYFPRFLSHTSPLELFTHTSPHTLFHTFSQVRVEDAEDTLYASIDVVCDKLERKMGRIKDRAIAKVWGL